MKENVSVLIPEDKVEERISQLAEEISRDYAGKTVHLIGILKGSVFFVCELAKRLTIPVTMDFMSVSSYGSGTRSTGVVKLIKDLDDSIMDKDVLVVEDIIDSGHTLSKPSEQKAGFHKALYAAGQAGQTGMRGLCRLPGISDSGRVCHRIRAGL